MLNAEERTTIREGFEQAFLEGQTFQSITDARKFAQQLVGRSFASGSREAKELEESIEQGIVGAAKADDSIRTSRPWRPLTSSLISISVSRDWAPAPPPPSSGSSTAPRSPLRTWPRSWRRLMTRQSRLRADRRARSPAHGGEPPDGHGE
jgi:hypothetical protein